GEPRSEAARVGQRAASLRGSPSPSRYGERQKKASPGPASVERGSRARACLCEPCRVCQGINLARWVNGRPAGGGRRRASLPPTLPPRRARGYDIARLSSLLRRAEARRAPGVFFSPGSPPHSLGGQGCRRNAARLTCRTELGPGSAATSGQPRG